MTATWVYSPNATLSEMLAEQMGLAAVLSWPSEERHVLAAQGGIVAPGAGWDLHQHTDLVAHYLVVPSIDLRDVQREHDRLDTLSVRIAAAADGRLEIGPLVRVARRQRWSLPVFTAQRGGISYIRASSLSSSSSPPAVRRRRLRPLIARAWAALPVHRACTRAHDDEDEQR